MKNGNILILYRVNLYVSNLFMHALESLNNIMIHSFDFDEEVMWGVLLSQKKKKSFIAHQMIHMVMGITMSSLSVFSRDHMKIKLPPPLRKSKLGPAIKFHIACAWLQLNKQ